MSVRISVLVLAGLLAAASVHAAPQTPAAPIAGKYNGEVDGGGAEVTITGAGPYKVHIIVGGDGCSGGVEGPAAMNAQGRLVLNAGHGCHVTMTKIAKGWTMAEDNCSYFHGDACNFTGTVVRGR